MIASGNNSEPELYEEDEEDDELINGWEYHLWVFRRAVEIIIFDDYDEEVDGELFADVKRNPPHEYVLYVKGFFEGYKRIELPYMWGIALDIINQILAKQRDNELINSRRQLNE